MEITTQQKDELFGFFAYVWNYHHNKKDPYYSRETNDFAFYAEKLDSSNISWTIQNLVSGAAEVRNNGFLSFNTILKDLKIIIKD